LRFGKINPLHNVSHILGASFRLIAIYHSVRSRE